MKNGKLTTRHFFLITIVGLFLFTCKKKSASSTESGSTPPPPTTSSSVVLPSGVTDSILFVMVKGSKVPVYLSIPPNSAGKSIPAMVLLHGSGGMWKDNNSSAGIMSEQNRDWKSLFNANGIAGAYVDSYEPRGCTERTGDWKDAPKAFKISAQFVRPYDAYAALSLLRSLKWPNDTPVIRSKDVGLLGFSDGATALAATLYDTKSTPPGHQWRQVYDKEYTQADGIGMPAERPVEGGFACGVFYYGGSMGNSFWNGDPCSSPNNFIYKTYAPVLYHLPNADPLTAHSLCAHDLLIQKGCTVSKFEYPGTDHGFDAADAGETGHAESELARSRTMVWLKTYLHLP